MTDLTFTAIDRDGSEQIVTDLYWFEEEGVHEVIDGVAEGHNATYRIVVQQIADLQRHNELLRAVAEAASGYLDALVTLKGSGSQEHTDIAYQWLYKWERAARAAIDGGAMGEG